MHGQLDALTGAPLRILMTSYRSHPYSGGQGIYMRHLTKALADLGHTVDVISGPPYPHLDPRVKLIKLPSLDLYASDTPLRALRPKHLTSTTDLYEWYAHNTGRFSEPFTYGQRLAKYMADKAHLYDVVHDNQTLSWGVLKLRDYGLPLVATLHHPITKDRDLALQANKGWRPRKAGLRLLIRRWHSFLPMQMKVAREIDHLLTISHSALDDFVSEFGLDKNKIKRIPIGVQTDQFRPMADIEREDDHIICTSSADVALKGLTHLISALAEVRKTRPNVRLTVVGELREGPTKRKLKSLKLEDAVTFVSGITDEELTVLYNRAAVAVVPSLYEGFGLPAGEAMACETPVISTSGGSLPEVVGDAGVLVPPGDASALAAAITGLLADPAARAKLSPLGRQRILDMFQWRQCAEETAALYRTAIADADLKTRRLTA